MHISFKGTVSKMLTCGEDKNLVVELNHNTQTKRTAVRPVPTFARA